MTYKEQLAQWAKAAAAATESLKGETQTREQWEAAEAKKFADT